MTTLIWCLLVATILPYIAKIPVAIAMNKAGGYDNRHPRTQQAGLTGFGARALAAHQNAFESLIVFAPAVLVALVTESTSEAIQYLALTHIGARVVYHVLYLLDIDKLRSLSWTVAIGCSFAIIWHSMPI